MVALEVELLFGMLGAGAPGVGQSLDGVQLGGAGGGLGVAFAGGVGTDVVVFGAGVGFGLPGQADLGVGVLADLGDLDAGVVADGLRACVGGVCVGAGLVSSFKRGLGVVPGGVHRRGGGLFGLDGPGRVSEGHGGLGLGLAAGGVSGGQRGGDPARVGGSQLGRGGTGQFSGLGKQLLQAGQRAAGRGGLLLPGGSGGQAVLVVPLA